MRGEQGSGLLNRGEVLPVGLAVGQQHVHVLARLIGGLSRVDVWVIVSRSQYDEAIEAQRAGWLIDAEGRMITAKRRREMRPARFEIRSR